MGAQRTAGHLHIAGHRLPIQALSGNEALNRPCYLNVTCPASLPLPGNELLNQPASVELQLIDGRNRWFHLQVQQLNLITDGKDRAEFKLASKLHQGSLQRRTRLMMDQDREQVLLHLLASMGYQSHELDLLLEPCPAPTGPFLQAGETNLETLQRLLAEIGANYWFEHPAGQDHETLVIRNNPSVNPYLPTIEWARAVSGLAPDDALNRITDARGHWHWQPSRVVRYISDAHRGVGNISDRGMTETTLDQANHQTFDPPLGRDAAEARALYDQQRRDARRYTLTLLSHQPLLTAGYCLPLDASSLPTGTLGGGTRGDFRIISVHHEAEARGGDDAGQGAGLAYRNSATLVPQSDPVRPELIKPPAMAPMFPARIESRYDHAELGNDGRYYFRLEADLAFESRQPYRPASHAQASPLAERLTPYASPRQDTIDTGWHFPLLNQSTILVTCLNNDPARPMILGFIPSRHQVGPVTADNNEQSRIVTPGQNELRFDDSIDAETIALHSFDQQTRLDLNAAGTGHYLKLAAQYGGLIIRAGKTLNLTTETGDLEERIGSDRSQRIKEQSHSQIDGHQRHQAEADQQHLAQFHLTQAADTDFSLWVQQKQLTRRIQTEGHSIEVKHGDYRIQVSDGALMHQVNGSLSIQGNGGGDIILIKGDTGVKIDPSGNIKLFGKKITLHGKQSGVTFNGEVSYDIGGGNEPEAVDILDLPTMPETELLVSELAPAIIAISCVDRPCKVGQETQLQVAHRALPDNAELVVSVEQVNPDGSTEVIDEFSHIMADTNAEVTIPWVAPSTLADSPEQAQVANPQPFHYRFKAGFEGKYSPWSEPTQINLDLSVSVTSDTGVPAKDGTGIVAIAADGVHHRSRVHQGTVTFGNIASGAARIRLETDTKSTKRESSWT